MARPDESGVRLFTRNGYDFAERFPRIVEAVESQPVQSCFVDGEAILVDDNVCWSAIRLIGATFAQQIPSRRLRPCSRLILFRSFPLESGVRDHC